MNHNVRKVSDRKCSITTSVIIGVAAAATISLLLTGGMTSLVLKGNMGSDGVNIAIFFVRALSVLIGCLIGTGLYKEKMLMIVGVIAGCYLLLITALGVVVFDGSVKYFFGGTLSVAAGGAGGCLIRLSAQKKPRYTIRNRV